MHYIPLACSQCFMHLDMCLIVENFVLLGLDWVEPMMLLFLARHMFMHISCICTLSFLYIYFLGCDGVFSLSLSLTDKLFMAPKHKFTPTQNPFCSSSSSSTDFPLFMFSFVMRRPIKTSLRTFLNVAFIRSAMWFYRILPTQLYLMSFTLKEGNLFIRYPWGVPSCSYRSFTPICTESIPLYLSLLRYSEVHIS